MRNQESLLEFLRSVLVQVLTMHSFLSCTRVPVQEVLLLVLRIFSKIKEIFFTNFTDYMHAQHDSTSSGHVQCGSSCAEVFASLFFVNRIKVFIVHR